jgi:hypothetical protein
MTEQRKSLQILNWGPICKHKTLRNLSGQYEFDHVGVLECGTKHVYNKYYSGYQCRICNWNSRMFTVK